MNRYDVKRLALVLACQTEIEGMKAENSNRIVEGHTIAFNYEDFKEKALDLQNLACISNDQL